MAKPTVPTEQTGIETHPQDLKPQLTLGESSIIPLDIWVGATPTCVADSSGNLYGVNIVGTDAYLASETYEGASGSLFKILTKTTTVTLTGAATSTAADFIPAGSMVLGCVARVTVLVTASGGGASFKLGYTADDDAFGTGIAFAAGTEIDNTDGGSFAGPVTFAAGDVITATADAGAFTAGVIRIVLWYATLTAPTA